MPTSGPAVSLAGGQLTFFVDGIDAGPVWPADSSGGWLSSDGCCADQPAAGTAQGGHLLGGPGLGVTSAGTVLVGEGTDQGVCVSAGGPWSTLFGTIVGGVGAVGLN